MLCIDTWHVIEYLYPDLTDYMTLWYLDVSVHMRCKLISILIWNVADLSIELVLLVICTSNLIDSNEWVGMFRYTLIIFCYVTMWVNVIHLLIPKIDYK